MKFLLKLATFFDRISELSGKLLAWLVYATMLLTCLVVVLRYGFSISIIALQESVTYVHAIVFMLGAAFTLQQDEHVRVDIFYRQFSERKKAIVNCLGSLLFLIPFSIFLLVISQDYVANAWAVRETSVEQSGIPAVYLLKTLIPAMAVMLLLQGLADLIKNLATLRR